MILNNIQMKRESKSFTDALYSILTAAQRFDGPKYMLSGLSGMAFKFSVHRRLLPMSVTAYGQWGTEHAPAIDNLGLHTVYDAGRIRHSSFEMYQQDAIVWIKQSIDAGIGAVYWIPEFGVIHGYDDVDRVFYIKDGWSKESQIVLYDNLGINFTSFWYCQVFGNQVEIPLKDAVLESLRLALHDWETPYKTWPDKNIASGRLAYQYLLQALKLGDYDPSGAAYLLDSYGYARSEIRDYLREVHPLYPGLDEIHRLYCEVTDLMTVELTHSVPFLKADRLLPEEHQASLCAALIQAEALEERAMGLARALSERYPDRKRSIVPRWGAHTAR